MQPTCTCGYLSMSFARLCLKSLRSPIFTSRTSMTRRTSTSEWLCSSRLDSSVFSALCTRSSKSAFCFSRSCRHINCKCSSLIWTSVWSQLCWFLLWFALLAPLAESTSWCHVERLCTGCWNSLKCQIAPFNGNVKWLSLRHCRLLEWWIYEQSGWNMNIHNSRLTPPLKAIKDPIKAVQYASGTTSCISVEVQYYAFSPWSTKSPCTDSLLHIWSVCSLLPAQYETFDFPSASFGLLFGCRTTEYSW